MVRFYFAFMVQLLPGWSLVRMLLGRNVSSVSAKKVKIKVTLEQALRLCTGRTAHRGSRGIALPFYDHVTRRG